MIISKKEDPLGIFGLLYQSILKHHESKRRYLCAYNTEHSRVYAATDGHRLHFFTMPVEEMPRGDNFYPEEGTYMVEVFTKSKILLEKARKKVNYYDSLMELISRLVTIDRVVSGPFSDGVFLSIIADAIKRYPDQVCFDFQYAWDAYNLLKHAVSDNTYVGQRGEQGALTLIRPMNGELDPAESMVGLLLMPQAGDSVKTESGDPGISVGGDARFFWAEGLVKNNGPAKTQEDQAEDARKAVGRVNVENLPPELLPGKPAQKKPDYSSYVDRVVGTA